MSGRVQILDHNGDVYVPEPPREEKRLEFFAWETIGFVPTRPLVVADEPIVVEADTDKKARRQVPGPFAGGDDSRRTGEAP